MSPGGSAVVRPEEREQFFEEIPERFGEGKAWKNEPCLKGDLSGQWHWHGAFRDSNKNMFRTTYSDTIHGREVAVKSDFPSGYGGHVACVAHDVLFKNTEVHEKLQKQAVDPQRDCFPSFMQQKVGAGSENKAKEETPTYGSLPDVRVQPPWAITPAVRSMPSYRMIPNMEIRNMDESGEPAESPC